METKEELVNHITNTLKTSNEMWEIALEKESTECSRDFVKIIGMLQSNLRLLRQEIINIDNNEIN